MKKGDLRKQEFLQTAETLFCKNGYEQTGVQEILDVLHASKGSFYHHFVSKESLLEAMFEKRAAQALEAAAQALAVREQALEESEAKLSELEETSENAKQQIIQAHTLTIIGNQQNPHLFHFLKQAP